MHLPSHIGFISDHVRRHVTVYYYLVVYGSVDAHGRTIREWKREVRQSFRKSCRVRSDYFTKMSYNIQSSTTAPSNTTISNEGQGEVSAQRLGNDKMKPPFSAGENVSNDFSESDGEESLDHNGSGGYSDLEPTEAEEATAPTYRSNIADYNANHHLTLSTSSTIHNPTPEPDSLVTTATSTGTEMGLITSPLQQTRRMLPKERETEGGDNRRSLRLQGGVPMVDIASYPAVRRAASNQRVPVDPPYPNIGIKSDESEHHSRVPVSGSEALSAIVTDGAEKAADSLMEALSVGHDGRRSNFDEEKSAASQDAQGAFQALEFSHTIGLRTPDGVQLVSASLPT